MMMFINQIGILVIIIYKLLKLFIKSSSDITSNNQELITGINIPILRLYYDLNGYVLIIDNKFDMYQINDLSWKSSTINMQRGPNSSKIQDI